MPIFAVGFGGAEIAFSLTLLSLHDPADRCSGRDSAYENCSSGFAGVQLQALLCVIKKFRGCALATLCSALGR